MTATHGPRLHLALDHGTSLRRFATERRPGWSSQSGVSPAGERSGGHDALDDDGWTVVRAATKLAAERLGDRLLSAYAIGSLAHGGFAPAVSDVDLALLTGELEPDIVEIIAAVTTEVARTHRLGARLSVFHAPWAGFADPPPGARFPPIDRFDLLRYGVLVHGADLPSHARHPAHF